MLPPCFFDCGGPRSSLRRRWLVASDADAGPSRMSGCDGDDPARTVEVSVVPGSGTLNGADGETLGVSACGDPMIIVSPDCSPSTGLGAAVAASTFAPAACEKSGFCPI